MKDGNFPFSSPAAIPKQQQQHHSQAQAADKLAFAYCILWHCSNWTTLPSCTRHDAGPKCCCSAMCPHMPHNFSAAVVRRYGTVQDSSGMCKIHSRTSFCLVKLCTRHDVGDNYCIPGCVSTENHLQLVHLWPSCMRHGCYSKSVSMSKGPFHNFDQLRGQQCCSCGCAPALQRAIHAGGQAA